MTQVEVELKEKLTCICRSEEGDLIETHGPKAYGGIGEKFNPTDLLAASLGSCILTIMGVYAGQLGVSIEGAKLKLIKEMQDAPRRVKKVVIEIDCPQEFEPKITDQLEKAARHCPVHLSLHPDIEQEITFKWGSLVASR
ncbi:MAG: OsmC family protein [Candidatus Algichlamydia australiensis]|nr:OsmC family protein [Chlamydiales bacterium]